MAKFKGVVGYVGSLVESAPGVWVDAVVERTYRGDVITNIRKLEADENVNSDISVNVSISIVADEYANGHIFAIRYVAWRGSLWVVSSVDVQRPRLILRLGGIYHGPLPA